MYIKMGIIRMAVGIMGNVATLFLYSAPIITFTRIIKKKNTEEFSCIPYIISLLECLVYGYYGTPVVSYGWENVPVVTIDAVGTLLESSFIVIYLWFAPKKEKIKVAAMTILTTLFFVFFVILSTFVYHDHHHRRLFVGCIGVVSAAAMYASPLVALKTVLKTKSVEFMPFYLSFFSLLSSTFWLIFGLLDLDFFLASPSIIGCILGIGQLALYFNYSKRGIKEEPDNWDIEKSEEKTKVEMQPSVKETINGRT